MLKFYKFSLALLTISFISLIINLYINQPINDIIIPTTNLIQTKLSKIHNDNYNNHYKQHLKENNKNYKIIIFPNDLNSDPKKLNSLYENQLFKRVTKNDILIINDEFNIKYPNNLKFEDYKVDIFDSFHNNNKNEKLLSKRNEQVEESKDLINIIDQPQPLPEESEKLEYNCSDKYRQINFQVSEYENRNVNLKKILTEFMKSSSPYYEEIKILIPNLKQQLQQNTYTKYWYQLIGSSVWLEQYGIHLLTSRIFYTRSGNKVESVISLVYVRAFDSDWNEIENLELIIPNGNTITNYKDYIEEEEVKTRKSNYKIVKYPQFLPIPIYNNVRKKFGNFYGPEDPRLILIKNKLGYDEPVIIFNSYHKRFSSIPTEFKKKGYKNFDFHRSIFMGWLWETQLGKDNIDELDEKYKMNEYVKIKELVLPNFKRMLKEKNWTPFIDLNQREMIGYDNSINLIYQFQNLKIIKCYFHEECCEWEYKMNEDTDLNAFRGGTQLINLKTILGKINNPNVNKDKNKKNNKELKIRNKKLNKLNNLLNSSLSNLQIWIGFARISLANCGCGDKFYRPNMFVLIKTSEFYKISHISNSLDFNINIKQWDIKNPDLCFGKNLIIPNGISSWEIYDNGNSKEEQEDLLTLSFSRADVTVDFIYIKGLLNSLFKDKDDDYIFGLNLQGLIENNNDINQITYKDFKSNDFTNFNIECSIKSGEQYCFDYAVEYNKTKETIPIINKQIIPNNKVN
ncbi:hypothetical protein KGF54_004878 [Candida jiufengensis]|uniref:uncharacterized protein n=1 Tax=Candida jiufengensis TaxID=497108 RepID=UPI002224F225|nr:uncharacterized protein KGF54_004878 [Candida jiufengensis]KAI5951803.1 hypothetical protein KGF54_004878 [Candida jiufengensis]